MNMLAAIYHGVGKVSLEQIAKPEVPEGAILIRNIRSGICGTDLHAYQLDGPEVGILPGNQFGHEMAGVIDQVGAGVTDFSVGQPVFINPCTFREPTPEMSALMCCDMAGPFSQYVRVDKPKAEYNVFALPPQMSWDIAAMTEPVSVALSGILKCRPKKGDRVLIYGGGIIGLCALACLRCMGIDDVIVTARNPFRSAKVSQLGGILCNTREHTVPDFVMQQWGKATGNNGEDTWQADVVLECAGYPGALEEIMRYAKCDSQVCVIALGTSEEKVTENNLCFKDISIHGSFAYTPAVNRQAIDLMAAQEQAFAPIATAVYGLSEIKTAFEQAGDTAKNVKVLIDHAR